MLIRPVIIAQRRRDTFQCGTRQAAQAVTVAEAAKAVPLYVPPALTTATVGVAGVMVKFASPVAAA